MDNYENKLRNLTLKWLEAAALAIKAETANPSRKSSDELNAWHSCLEILTQLEHDLEELEKES